METFTHAYMTPSQHHQLGDDSLTQDTLMCVSSYRYRGNTGVALYISAHCLCVVKVVSEVRLLLVLLYFEKRSYS